MGFTDEYNFTEGNEGNEEQRVARTDNEDENEDEARPYVSASKMVGWQGLEPWTNALKGHCSTN